MTLGAVLERMSPGTEADFLARFATRVLGEVSIDDLPPVMQVHDLIAHYQVRCFSNYFFCLNQYGCSKTRMCTASHERFTQKSD